jgi:ferredoxin
MRVVVDLNRCQSYGQCVFAAPTVFRWHGEESLEYGYAPDEALRGQAERSAAACPVQAISLGRAPETGVAGTGAGT